MTLYRFVVPVLAAAVFFAAPARAEAELLSAVEVNRAVNVVEELHTDLTNLMLSDETELKPRMELIGPTLIKVFDLRAMTRAIVGSRVWRDLDDSAQQDAVSAFSDWMVTQYASRFSASSDPDFLTRETRDGGLNTVVIETQLRTPKRVVSLDYRMRAVDGDFKIIDVFLDGRVSEVALRKSEFRKSIKENGIAGFMDAVKAKTAALSTPS